MPVVGDTVGGVYFRPESMDQQILVGSVRERDELEVIDDPDGLNLSSDQDFPGPHDLRPPPPDSDAALPGRGRGSGGVVHGEPQRRASHCWDPPRSRGSGRPTVSAVTASSWRRWWDRSWPRRSPVIRPSSTRTSRCRSWPWTGSRSRWQRRTCSPSERRPPRSRARKPPGRPSTANAARAGYWPSVKYSP